MNWWTAKRTVASFQDEMTGTTAVLGRDKSVKVTFKGQKAYAKDGVVNFPDLDQTMTLDWDAMSLFRGWVDHESAKVRFSDRPFMDNIAKEDMEKNPLLHDIFTTIEGVRVERGYIDLYQGSSKNLGEMSKQVADMAIERHKLAVRSAEAAEPKHLLEGIDEEPKDPVMKEVDPAIDPKSLFPAALGAYGRQDFEGVYNWSTLSKLKPYVDEVQMNQWADHIATLNSTEEAYEFAKTILEQMENQDEDQDQDQESGDDGEGDSEGEGKGKESPYAQQHKPIDMSDVIDNGVMGGYQYRKGKANVPYRVFNRDYDEINHWSDGNWAANVEYYMEAKKNIDSSLSTMKRRIELLIQATRKIDWENMKEQGRFDSRRMVGAYNAEPNVFKTRDDASDLDTAVGILIDLSGSMAGAVYGDEGYIRNKQRDSYKRKSDAALETSILLGECMDKIGVPFCITGFDAHEKGKLGALYEEEVYHNDGDEDDWGRMSATRTHEFKRFQDRMFDARKYMHHIGQLNYIAGGNNCDCEAVFHEVQRLLKRPEKRKVLFVLSDGQPESAGNRDTQRAKLKSVVLEGMKNVDIVGIGIQDSSVKNFYPNHVILKGGDKLPEVALGLLKDALLPNEKKMAA